MIISKLTNIETNLVKQWCDLESAASESDSETSKEARSSLASAMAYLLNLFLSSASEANWCGFGADDLLDAVYVFQSREKMTATGLMCWGDLDQIIYLSPFLGEFERDLEQLRMKDFTLLFSPDGPDEGPFMLPYTRDERVRHLLLESCPKSLEEWAHVYQRQDLLS